MQSGDFRRRGEFSPLRDIPGDSPFCHSASFALRRDAVRLTEPWPVASAAAGILSINAFVCAFIVCESKKSKKRPLLRFPPFRTGFISLTPDSRKGLMQNSLFTFFKKWRPNLSPFTAFSTTNNVPIPWKLCRPHKKNQKNVIKSQRR